MRVYTRGRKYKKRRKHDKTPIKKNSGSNQLKKEKYPVVNFHDTHEALVSIERNIRDRRAVDFAIVGHHHG